MDSLTNKISIYNNGSILLSTSRRSGNFLIVNPDYQQVWDSTDFKYYKNVSRPTRNRTPYGASSGQGLPAVARFLDGKYVKFTRDLQFWVHELCYENTTMSEQEKKNDFHSMWRDNAFMSNYAGSDTRADYINENGKPPFIMVQPQVCGGTLLKSVGSRTYTGVDSWLVEAINPETQFELYHPSTHPWLFFRPTISVRRWIFDTKGNAIKKEEMYNEPFDDYNEESVVPIFGFIPDNRSSTGYCNVIEKYRCRILGNSEAVPNPFLLRDGRIKINPYEGF